MSARSVKGPAVDLGTIAFIILTVAGVTIAVLGLIFPQKFNELCGGRWKHTLRARRVLRSFYVARDQMSPNEQQHYLQRELRRIGVLKQEGMALIALIELLEKTARVLTLRELRSACRLPGEALDMQLRR